MPKHVKAGVKNHEGCEIFTLFANQIDSLFEFLDD